MKKVPNWIKIVALLVLVILSKFLFFSKPDQTSPVSAAKKGGALAVNYYVAKMADYSNRVFATGKLGAFNQVDIIPEVNAKVITIFFKEGELVSQGDLLVKLNDADLQASLLKIETQLKLAEQKLERLKKLRDIKGVSDEEYEMQENEIAVLKADKAYSQAQLAKTNIRAPFAGKLGLKNISEGAFANTTTPIISLVQMKPLFVEFSVPDRYATLIKKDMPVEFEIENTQSSETFSASVYAIEPKVDELTKTIRIRANYAGNKNLYPGSFAKVYLTIGETLPVLMIPTQCLVPTLKGQKVFVVKNGIANEVMVKIGQRNDQKIAILEGLQEGDTLITSGLMAVKKETKVTLIKTLN